MAYTRFNPQERKIRESICEIGRRIWQRGFCAGNEGNHSVRVGAPEDDRYLCTPTGISKGFLEPDDIVVVNGEAEQIEPNVNGRKPTSEAKIHMAVYKARPDVTSVIHSHPPHAVAFCLAGVPLPEGIHPEAEVFLGRTIFARYATPSTYDLPNSFLPKLNEETTTILMANHGSISLGKDITEAYYRLEILDNYCKQLILARQLGNVNTLSPQEMTELLKVKEKFGFKDSRLACAAEGCATANNDAFLAGFDIRPQTAKCSCDGGAVSHESPGVEASELETMVNAITDRIMSGLN